jgi:hypothetical protein
VIVAGYSNVVKGYIPSKRVLEEGGYEAGESRSITVCPSFTPAVEDTICSAMKETAAPGRIATLTSFFVASVILTEVALATGYL